MEESKTSMTSYQTIKMMSKQFLCNAILMIFRHACSGRRMSKRKVQVISFDCNSKPLPPAMHVMFHRKFPQTTYSPWSTESLHKPVGYFPRFTENVHKPVISHVSLKMYTNQLFPKFHLKFIQNRYFPVEKTKTNRIISMPVINQRRKQFVV